MGWLSSVKEGIVNSYNKAKTNVVNAYNTIKNYVVEKWNGLSKVDKTAIGIGTVVPISGIAYKLGNVISDKSKEVYNKYVEPTVDKVVKNATGTQSTAAPNTTLIVAGIAAVAALILL